LYGYAVQAIFGLSNVPANTVAVKIKSYVAVLGTGFTKALQFLIIPLVLVSIINAVTKINNTREAGKKAGKIIFILLLTTAISAVISIIIVKIFGLSADNLIEYNKAVPDPVDVPSTILNLVPSNLFEALAQNAALPIVFIAVVLSIAYLSIRKEGSPAAAKFESFIKTAYEFVMKIVEFVMALTPYGILAIIANRISDSNWQVVSQLGLFVGACFVAMTIVFILHIAVIWILGVRPDKYLKKTAAPLLFAFSSRSSAATLPLTIAAQRKLGISEANANIAGSLGTCVGQNGCAGVYPTMLAIMVGLVQGWNVWSLGFLIPLVIFVVIASIGTAGVGGGAINVSLLVLSLLGLPIELVTILIAVDFIVDMGRTLLNVNDSILAGFLVGKWEKDINNDVLNDKITVEQWQKQEAEVKQQSAKI
jgi:L-cystine uptake protein TcyP (sodium:dicarboxylate symporter family)